MTSFPFPHNQRLEHCTYPRLANPDDARRAFHRWREEIVTSDGARGFVRTRRVDSDGEANSTVSEGIAYGMIIAAMFGDQALFDGFWSYGRCFLNRNGLMDWYIAADGSRALGTGAATDADEDMAWALLQAHRQWGGNGAFVESYLSMAQRLIDAIYRTEVDHGDYADMLLPGDSWRRRRNVFNPSYFAPNQYRLFGDVSGNRDGWQRVIDQGYVVLNRSLNAASGNSENGLVPAWCNDQGEPIEAFPGARQNYQYDSARMPFRMAQDWAYAQEPRAGAYLQKVTGFFAQIGAESIVDGYTLDGRPAPDQRSLPGNPGSAVFVGCAAAGAMYDPAFRDFLDAAYARVRTGELLTQSRYYNHCWTVLSLLMLSGNLIEFPPD